MGIILSLGCLEYFIHVYKATKTVSSSSTVKLTSLEL